MRVMNNKIVKLFSVNSNRLKNQMMSLKDTTYNRDLDFVHVTEAGLGVEAAADMKGFRAFKVEDDKHTRGSVLYLREEYARQLLRVEGTEVKNVTVSLSMSD